MISGSPVSAFAFGGDCTQETAVTADVRMGIRSDMQKALP